MDSTPTCNLELGYLELLNGRTDEALGFLQKAFDSAPADGTEYFKAGRMIVASNLQRGRIETAILLAEEMHEETSAEHGLGSAEALRTHFVLAYAYVGAERLQEALEILPGIQKDIEKRFGSDHPENLSCLSCLANAYSLSGRHDEAVEGYESGLVATLKRVDESHPRVAFVRESLAESLAKRGDIDEALEIWRKVVDSYTDDPTKPSYDRLTTLESAASALNDASRFGEAIELLKSEFELMQSKEGLGEQHTLSAAQAMSLAQIGIGQHDEGMALLRQAIKVANDKEDVVLQMELEASLAKSSFIVDGAEQGAQIAEEYIKKARGEFEGDLLATALAEFGELFVEHKRYERGNELFREAVQVHEAEKTTPALAATHRCQLGVALLERVASATVLDPADPNLVQAEKLLVAGFDELQSFSEFTIARKQVLETAKSLVRLFELKKDPVNTELWGLRLEALANERKSMNQE